ncbi:hypothetical protein [Rhodohalobacter sp. SW132]|uniref:hypothetical protein n=1 Tax=Rhodohalobacter sp. SW132 TaxID=2293433 RepID=UPI0013157F1F|nr:hypothetical protein [Rhodohalobacter sp. SW132]
MARSMDVCNKFAYKEGLVAEISNMIKHGISDGIVAMQGNINQNRIQQIDGLLSEGW